MPLSIRRGTEKDVDALAGLYDEVTEHLERTVNYPGWKKGVYPTRQDAQAGVREGRLFLAESGGRLAAAMILRSTPEPAYAQASWQAALSEEEVLVLYTFVVSPTFWGQGVGKAMLAFAEKEAAAEKVKALRLDVSEQNLPAIRLYEKCGFHYVATVSLGLEEAGLPWFRLYEKLL